MEVNIEDYFNLMDNWAHREYLRHEYELMYRYLVLENYNPRAAARRYRDENEGLRRYPNYHVFLRLNRRMRRIPMLVPNQDDQNRFSMVSKFLKTYNYFSSIYFFAISR